MKINIPNLDAMDPADLRAYAQECLETIARIPRKYHAQRALYTLANRYATTKSCAMVLRAEGNIGRAYLLEQSCDALYERIPVAHRW